MSADRRSLLRLVLDTFLYRLLLVAQGGCNRLRTVRLNGSVTLTYRPNRGDIGTLVETWFTDEYVLPIAVRKRGLIVDLGANIGATAVFLVRRYEAMSYIGVEPVPSNAALARRNLQQNGVPAVLIEAAVGPVAREASFAEDRSSTLGQLGPGDRLVQVVTVEDALAGVDPSERVALLKLDIEGGEETLFSSNVGWLERVDALVAELHPDLCNVDPVLRTLARAGFVEHRMENDEPAGLEYVSCFVRRHEARR
jgi:FkbM family methyltransferase